MVHTAPRSCFGTHWLMLRLQKSVGWQSASDPQVGRHAPEPQLKCVQAVSFSAHTPVPSQKKVPTLAAAAHTGVPQLVVLSGKAQARLPLHEPPQAPALSAIGGTMLIPPSSPAPPST